MKYVKVLMLSATALATAAGALEHLEVSRARGGAMDGYPWQSDIKTLWGKGDPCGNMMYIQNEDDYHWDYQDPDPPQNYLWEIYEFVKPINFEGGRLRWRIWGTSGNEVSIWHWLESTQQWDCIDSYTGNGSMPAQVYEPVYPSWFNIQIGEGDPYTCYFLVVNEENTGGYHLISDVVDMDYAE